VKHLKTSLPPVVKNRDTLTMLQTRHSVKPNGVKVFEMMERSVRLRNPAALSSRCSVLSSQCSAQCSVLSAQCSAQCSVLSSVLSAQCSALSARH